MAKDRFKPRADKQRAMESIRSEPADRAGERQLEDNWKAVDLRKNPEHRPSPVRVLSREEIAKLYPLK